MLSQMAAKSYLTSLLLSINKYKLNVKNTKNILREYFFDRILILNLLLVSSAVGGKPGVFDFAY